MKNIYKITFLEPRAKWNWVTVSSIDKETFQGFIEYLYNLDRDIEILLYIPGGYAAPMHIREDLDKTYLVKEIVKVIKDKKPIKEIYKILQSIRKDEDYESDIAFIEDVYELSLSLGIPKDIALEHANNQTYLFDRNSLLSTYTEDERVKAFISMFKIHDFYFPYISRYEFIYMFRGEFIRYIKAKGYDNVSVDGGWVLNDKEREMELGIIDGKGYLL